MNKLAYKMNKILILHGEQMYPQQEKIILTQEQIILIDNKRK